MALNSTNPINSMYNPSVTSTGVYSGTPYGVTVPYVTDNITSWQQYQSSYKPITVTTIIFKILNIRNGKILKALGSDNDMFFRTEKEARSYLKKTIDQMNHLLQDTLTEECFDVITDQQEEILYHLE